MNQPPRIVVLISGGGSNLQSIIDHCSTPAIDATIVAVISNRADAYGLQRAARSGIPTYTLDNSHFETRETFDAALRECIDQHTPDLLVLAGFMRRLTAGFVQHYTGRIINIHPSLLPALTGLDTHQRALDQGFSQHGATVHFVTPQLDSGPLIIQAAVNIEPNDTAESLATRVLQAEHRIYPKVIGWFTAGRLRSDGMLAWLDDEPIHNPLGLNEDEN